MYVRDMGIKVKKVKRWKSKSGFYYANIQLRFVAHWLLLCVQAFLQSHEK